MATIEIERFEYGGQTRVTATFDGSVAPAARVKAPDKTITTPTPEPTGTPNQYRFDIPRDQVGTWAVRVYDEGGSASTDALFYVEPDPTA